MVKSLREKPTGNTDNFIWFITDIWIAVLFKEEKNFEFYNSCVGNEEKIIALYITKEEKEYIEIKEKKLFLFYS